VRVSGWVMMAQVVVERKNGAAAKMMRARRQKTECECDEEKNKKQRSVVW
jgi:hypothetical protein